MFTAFGFQTVHEIGGEQAIGFGEAEAIFAIPTFPMPRKREYPAGKAGEFTFLEFAHGGGVDITAAGAVNHVHDFGTSVGRGLQAGRAGIHAGIKHGDHHAAAVVFRMRLKKGFRPGLAFGHQGRERAVDCVAGETGQFFVQRIGDRIDRRGVAAGKDQRQHGGHTFHGARD